MGIAGKFIGSVVSSAGQVVGKKLIERMGSATQAFIDEFRRMGAAHPNQPMGRTIDPGAPPFVFKLQRMFEDEDKKNRERNDDALHEWGTVLQQEIDRLNKQLRARVRNWVAVGALRSGHLDDAERLLQMARNDCSDPTLLLYILANQAVLSLREGEFLEAGRRLEEAASIDPKALIVQYNWLVLASLMQNRKACEKAATDLFETHPDMRGKKSPVWEDPDLDYFRGVIPDSPKLSSMLPLLLMSGGVVLATLAAMLATNGLAAVKLLTTLGAAMTGG